MSEQRPLHRLFGLSWMDFLEGSNIGVEREKDLSLRQQFLDLVLTRKGPGPPPGPLPDGFDDLADHNLFTFKSCQEALDEWTLYELVAHFVNYRKQVSPSLENLLPMTAFRLFALCVRFPHNLAQLAALTPIQQGVYETAFLSLRIRVIVVHQLPVEQQNAILHVFSANKELLRYGREHYRPRSMETSTLLYELFKAYEEDPEMSKIIDDFVRESIDDMLKSPFGEEIRKRLSPEERLKGLSLEERLKGLSPEERLEGLSPEERLEGLSPEERLKGLSPEELRAALEAAQRRLQANGGPSSKPQ